MYDAGGILRKVIMSMTRMEYDQSDIISPVNGQNYMHIPHNR